MRRATEGMSTTTVEPPDRASSREITFTSPDAPADGMPRKTAHERHLSRRRSSQSEELTMNGGQARTPSHPVVAAGPEVGPKSRLFWFSELNRGYFEPVVSATVHRAMT